MAWNICLPFSIEEYSIKKIGNISMALPKSSKEFHMDFQHFGVECKSSSFRIYSLAYFGSDFKGTLTLETIFLYVVDQNNVRLTEKELFSNSK